MDRRPISLRLLHPGDDPPDRGVTPTADARTTIRPRSTTEPACSRVPATTASGNCSPVTAEGSTSHQVGAVDQDGGEGRLHDQGGADHARHSGGLRPPGGVTLGGQRLVEQLVAMPGPTGRPQYRNGCR